MFQQANALSILGGAVIASGIGLVSCLYVRHRARLADQQFHVRLLRQASRWLADQWRMSEEELFAALNGNDASEPSMRGRLTNLLSIEFEVQAAGWSDCEVRVHVAVWRDSAVRLGTIVSRSELEQLPGYVRERLLARHDAPALFQLWGQIDSDNDHSRLSAGDRS